MTGRDSDGPSEDWGGFTDHGQAVAETGTPVAAASYRLADARLDNEALEDWPDPPPPREPQGELDRSRAALVAHPGQIRRLSFVFDDRDSADKIAAGFAGVDPTEVVPGADGHFDTVVEHVGGRFRIAARYVPPPPERVFPDAGTWVAEWLVPTIHRPMKAGVVWCPQWWRHLEAVARLDALWRAWETARAGGGDGPSLWWTMHFENHWAALTDSTRGPFAACKDQVHDSRLEPLGCDSPPEDFEWPNPYPDH